MEPVTHVLTGICLARAGANRKARYATAVMALAAEFPDIDTVWSLRGPVEGFVHHRGITHTFVGVPFEAALIVAGAWLWHRSRERSTTLPGGGKAPKRPTAKAPVHWGWLYLFALLALLSHLLLDYTNNYGIRPFFPFNPHWYAWSIVFIFDPWIFLLLVGALAAPWLFGLIGSEVGARVQGFRGRGWAVAALTGIVLWWGFRSVQHTRALAMVAGQSIAAPAVPNAVRSSVDSAGAAPEAVAPPTPVPVYLSVRRALASPDMLNPFRWYAVMDFGPVYQRAQVSTWAPSLDADNVLTPKPAQTQAERLAEATPIGRAYVDWSPMPFISAEPGDDGSTVVSFQDPRFMGGLFADQARPPLEATVTISPQGRVVEQTMGGRVER
jgi:inner membrane protein